VGVFIGVLVGVNVGVSVGVLVDVLVGVGVGVYVGVSVGVLVGVKVGVRVGVREGVLVGVNVGVFVGVSVGVFVGVEGSVAVVVSVVVTVNCTGLLGVGVTRTRITTLGVLVGICVSVGEAVMSDNGVTVSGAGTKIIPRVPTITSTNPLAKLIINNLGYFMCVNEPYQDTIDQFTIQIKVMVGILSAVGQDCNPVCLVFEVIDCFYREISPMLSATETDPLIGHEEKASVLDVKMILTLSVILSGQSDGRNIQDNLLLLAKNQIAGSFEKGGVDIRGRAENIRA